MVKKNSKTDKIRPAITGLRVGQSTEFPILRMKSVRTQASELGAIYDRKYKTHTDRINRVIVVTREK